MNHAQEARDLLQPLQALAGKDAAFDLELAQAHATLALAKQQRIANLIALLSHDNAEAFRALYVEVDKDSWQGAPLKPEIASILEIGDQS